MKKKFFNPIVAIALLMLNVNDTVAQTTTVGKGDLPAFELKGNVKSCKWINANGSEGETTYTFNAKGQWTKTNGYLLTNSYETVERNSVGRISSTEFWEDGTGYLDEWHFNQTGHLSRKVEKLLSEDYTGSPIVDCTGTYTYEYDNKGFVTAKKYSYSERYDGKKWSSTYTYTYLATDTKGNWTKRKVVDSGENKTYTETRVITYY